MDQINVIWKSYHKPEIIDRDYWDQGILEDMFKSLDCKHLYDVDELVQGEGADHQGGIFIINGRTHVEDTEKINQDIAKLRWVLFIITGDEEATFPWRKVRHPLMRVWIQLPRMNEHNDTAQKLPNGYRPTTRNILTEIGMQNKTNEWMFAGQINHPRREQCVEAAKQLKEPGIIVETGRFGEEKLAYKEYLTIMSQSKIVLCPSGIETPDSFRLYEALEAGCLPIVDAFSTRHQAPGFWKYLFGDNTPFPIVDYWDKLPILLPELLRGYPHNANKAFAWWQQYKRSLLLNLLDTIKELSR